METKKILDGFSPKVKKYLKDNLPKPNEFIVFKHVKADRLDESVRVFKGSVHNAYNRKNNNSSWFVGYETFYDEGDGAQKLIKYVRGTNTRLEDGKEVVSEEVGDIIFNSRGVCIVRGGDPTKGIFMLLSAHHKNNPFRPKNSPISIEWELVEAKSELEDDNFRFEMIDEAITKINAMDHEERLAVASSLAKDYSQFRGMGRMADDPRYLKNKLRTFCDMEPDAVLIAAQDKKAMKKIQIRDAFKKNLLKFDAGTDSWYLEDMNGDEVSAPDKSLLRVTVEPIEDKREKLEKVLSGTSKLGKQFYKGMIQLLTNGFVHWIDEKELADEHSDKIST